MNTRQNKRLREYIGIDSEISSGDKNDDAISEGKL